MNQIKRRTFMLHAVAAGATLTGPGLALAAPTKVDEADPKAASLGYRNDSNQVDKKRFPKHSAGEKCSGCMAWLGKPSDAWAECDLMVNKLVANAGWCSSFVKLKG
ncbi:MAG: high-potential iron-sulfur protein [Burkholderiales bacterium]|jgi:hypothetical protein|nr:high-potential iron-sulfur protein [Burkholderiales bacterium]